MVSSCGLLNKLGNAVKQTLTSSEERLFVGCRNLKQGFNFMSVKGFRGSPHFLFMATVSPLRSCLEIINDAIYLNNTGGNAGREERDQFCDRWLLTYFDNCRRQLTTEKIIQSTVFGEVTTLLVDSVQSYRFGHLEASMAMLRASIDALFFCVGEKKLVWTDSERKVCSFSPVTPIEWWRSAPRGEVDAKMWSNAALIRDRGYVFRNEFDRLKKLREKGNFSAHFFAQRMNKFSKIVEDLGKADSESTNASVVQSLKQYTSGKEAMGAIKEALQLILKVQKAHVIYLMK